MPRIAGVNIPDNKRIFVSLTYIYGIGRSKALSILKRAEVDPMKKANELTDDELSRIRKIIENEEKVEGELRKEVSMNIKRLIEIGCYRGLRHKAGLPVRGQRTSSNARTRKGPRGNMLKRRKK
ncbi:MAG: 30S ribosomal protein S13 [Candidatus Aminicenantes bacterium]|nr:30S ribosomal protein S13 [Candidatus Aminicenantes bacterium]